MVTLSLPAFALAETDQESLCVVDTLGIVLLGTLYHHAGTKAPGFAYGVSPHRAIFNK